MDMRVNLLSGVPNRCETKADTASGESRVVLLAVDGKAFQDLGRAELGRGREGGRYE